MKIESVDMFNCLCIDEYIFQSRSNNILYSMLVLFTIVQSLLLKQVGLEKAQRGSTSTVWNKVRTMIPQCYIFGFSCIWERIDFYGLSVCCGTPQSIGSFSLSHVIFVLAKVVRIALGRTQSITTLLQHNGLIIVIVLII